MRVGYGYTLRVFRTASVRTIHVLGRIAKLPGIQLIVVLYLALRACVSEGLTIPHLPPPPKPVSHSPPTISLSPPLHFLEGRTGSMVLSSKPIQPDADQSTSSEICAKRKPACRERKNVQQEYGSYVVGWCLCSRAQSSATGLGYLERKSWSPKAGLLLLAQQEAQDTRQISRFRRECMCIPPAPFAPAPSERQAGLWQIGRKRHFCPFFSGKPRLCQVFIFVSLVVPGPAS